MDIKDIVLKVGLQAFEEHPYDEGHVVSPSGYTWIDDKLIEFAEVLISAYKAELLKEVGEPVAFMCSDEELCHKGYERFSRHNSGEWNIPIFTSDQVAAAILKATKPLEEKLAAAQEANEHWQRATAENENKWIEANDKLTKAEQLWQVAQGRCDGLEEKLVKAEQRVAEWQPIETAPKDGQSYLTYSTEFVNQYWVTDKCNGMTHWMPLPKAPANGGNS